MMSKGHNQELEPYLILKERGNKIAREIGRSKKEEEGEEGDDDQGFV